MSARSIQNGAGFVIPTPERLKELKRAATSTTPQDDAPPKKKKKSLEDEDILSVLARWLNANPAKFGDSAPYLRQYRTLSGEPKSRKTTLIVTSSFDNHQTPIHIDRKSDSVSVTTEATLTMEAALEMALLIQGSPLAAKGVEILGSEQDQIMLAAAATQVGLKILSDVPDVPPAMKNDMEKLYQIMTAKANGVATTVPPTRKIDKATIQAAAQRKLDELKNKGGDTAPDETAPAAAKPTPPAAPADTAAPSTAAASTNAAPDDAAPAEKISLNLKNVKKNGAATPADSEAASATAATAASTAATTGPDTSNSAASESAPADRAPIQFPGYVQPYLYGGIQIDIDEGRIKADSVESYLHSLPADEAKKLIAFYRDMADDAAINGVRTLLAQPLEKTFATLIPEEKIQQTAIAQGKKPEDFAGKPPEESALELGIINEDALTAIKIAHAAEYAYFIAERADAMAANYKTIMEMESSKPPAERVLVATAEYVPITPSNFPDIFENLQKFNTVPPENIPPAEAALLHAQQRVLKAQWFLNHQITTINNHLRDEQKQTPVFGRNFAQEYKAQALAAYADAGQILYDNDKNRIVATNIKIAQSALTRRLIDYGHKPMQKRLLDMERANGAHSVYDLFARGLEETAPQAAATVAASAAPLPPKPPVAQSTPAETAAVSLNGHKPLPSMPIPAAPPAAKAEIEQAIATVAAAPAHTPIAPAVTLQDHFGGALASAGIDPATYDKIKAQVIKQNDARVQTLRTLFQKFSHKKLDGPSKQALLAALQAEKVIEEKKDKKTKQRHYVVKKNPSQPGAAV